MKKTAEELISVLKNYEEALGENFLGLLEDVADSVVDATPVEPDYSGYVKKEEYDTLKQKYIDRFTMKEEVKDQIQKQEPMRQDPAENITYENLFDGSLD